MRPSEKLPRVEMSAPTWNMIVTSRWYSNTFGTLRLTIRLRGVHHYLPSKYQCACQLRHLRICCKPLFLRRWLLRWRRGQRDRLRSHRIRSLFRRRRWGCLRRFLLPLQNTAGPRCVSRRQDGQRERRHHENRGCDCRGFRKHRRRSARAEGCLRPHSTKRARQVRGLATLQQHHHH